MSHYLIELLIWCVIVYILGCIVGWIVRSLTGGSAATATAGTMATAASSSVAATAAAVLSKPKGIAGARAGKADELQRLSGVGPKNEAILHHLGFFISTRLPHGPSRKWLGSMII